MERALERHHGHGQCGGHPQRTSLRPRRALQVGPFSPGIFAIGNIAVAINSDGSIAAPAGAIPGVATKPAKIGDPGGL